MDNFTDFNIARYIAIESGRDCIVECINDEGIHEFIPCYSKCIINYLENAERITIIKNN